MMCKCEDENYLRKIIREELSKMRQEHLNKNQPTADTLVALYMDNFPSDRIKPPGATVGGQIKLILKQLPYEQLAALIPILSNGAKPITAAWLNWAKDQVEPKAKIGPATPTPPRFTSAEAVRNDSTPMPANFRDIVFKRSMGSMGDEQP